MAVREGALGNDSDATVLPFPGHSSGDSSSSLPLGAVLVLGDLVALISAWLIVGVALHRWWGRPWSIAGACVAVMVAIGLALLHYIGLHRARICTMRSVELAKLGRVAACSAVVAYAVGLVPRDQAEAATVAGLLVFTTLAMERGVYRAWVRGVRRRGQALRRVLVLGSTADTDLIVPMISDFPELGYQVSGVMTLDLRPNDSPADADNNLAGRVLDQARALGVSGLIVATGAAAPTETAQLVRCAMTMGFHVQVWGGLPGIDQRRLQPLPFGHQPGFYLAPSVVGNWQRIAKRALDLIVVPLLLLLSAPIMLLVMLLIKLDDGGPVLFSQRRIGKDGHEFMLFKFRSMVVDAEARLAELVRQNERHGPLFKLQVDPRSTRIGKFLRASSLDELPQLINVLRGEMTLVGPRPALATEVANFDEELLRRMRVAPGITGLWQVEARDNPSFDAYRSLDLFYVDNWSLGVDLAILASTAAAVLARGVRALRPPKSSVRQQAATGTARAEVFSGAGS